MQLIYRAVSNRVPLYTKLTHGDQLTEGEVLGHVRHGWLPDKEGKVKDRC